MVLAEVLKKQPGRMYGVEGTTAQGGHEPQKPPRQQSHAMTKTARLRPDDLERTSHEKEHFSGARIDSVSVDPEIASAV